MDFAKSLARNRRKRYEDEKETNQNSRSSFYAWWNVPSF
ncbi:hypothetical protein E34_0332 [Lactococcus lactis subsp. lactis]|uniref:Uncharacterized protein n=1 Tax=Lactococcus lactis subsp. lactis TaxID=1360 RepID=A0A0V8AUU3_LACLL|nr:hypothetical protein Llab_0712 [Lactococcus lactis]KST80522.1 hypothetical protein E34_0332 [Lactococcus lactis subsp. lactis]KSU20243.1 hypothetical protein M20_1578 [Lactococcus lactis subsp. lactis]